MQALAAEFSSYAGKFRCVLARNEHAASASGVIVAG